MKSPERMEKIKRVVSQRQAGLVVVIENMEDPHNAMAIVRTCDAMGVQDVHLIAQNVKPVDPFKVGRSAASTAKKWVDYHHWDSTKECLESLKEQGHTVVATVLSDKATSIYETDLTQENLAILIGNEKEGLSEEAIALSDVHLSIPMRGMVQSLNVSVAAAMVLCELTRQRLPDMEQHVFDAETQEQFVEDFSKR